jgi:hypothetical protein
LYHFFAQPIKSTATMENYNPAPNDDTIRQVLKAQDENIHHLRTLISNISADNLTELRNTLTEQLQQLEDLEQLMWSALFPSVRADNQMAQRMTMSYTREQYY